MGPGDLREALSWLPVDTAEELLVGFETSDDAAVYRFDDKTALLQTVDFFPPIVDSPYMFGQIAAANALSDIYAMGGKPITALNLVAYPCKIGMDILGAIMQGGHDKVKEAGAVTVGGHSIQDNEPKYGLAVTGIVPIDGIVTNSGAKPGDVLVLTKPLGMGILASALKKGHVTETEIDPAIQSAATLNRYASEAMVEVGVRACTDVTGFGLMGHLREMAAASGVKAIVEFDKVPVWDKAVELARQGIVPGGAKTNWVFLEDTVVLPPEAKIPPDILFDPQTSGGLLISVPAGKADRLLAALEANGVATHAVIGRIEDGVSGIIEVI
jgi:selenide,water dikinase